MPLEGRGIGFGYRQDSWILRNVEVSIAPGERVGLTGPSGRGKTTLAWILSGHLKPREGGVLVDGRPLPMRGYCPVQLVLQHPEKAVNPRWRMREILAEGWMPDQETLDAFGIEPKWLKRWPNELSAGELQRFCVVRALGPQTRYLILDEISTMLDALSQAQIWRALVSVAWSRKLGLLVVSHDLPLLRQVCSRIIFMPEAPDGSRRYSGKSWDFSPAE